MCFMIWNIVFVKKILNFVDLLFVGKYMSARKLRIVFYRKHFLIVFICFLKIILEINYINIENNLM